MDEIYSLKREALRIGLSHKTIVTYVQCIKQFMKHCRKDFRSITKGDITSYIDFLIDKKACGNTLNVHINALKFMFQEILGRRATMKIKYCKTAKSLPVYLTKEEIIRLFNTVENPKHKLILELMYSAGLRVGEVVNLRKQDLEFEQGIGWVRKGKGNKDRLFIIAKYITERLKHHIIACCSEPNSYVFPGRKNAQLHVRTIQEIVSAVAKKARINKKIHPHSLRHSFATHLIENGYDVIVVQPLMGHSRMETTSIYVHAASPLRISVKSPYDMIHEQRNL